MLVQQAAAQTDSILRAVHSEEDPPTGVLEIPGQSQEHQTSVSWGEEHSVPMVASECELALSGRLSPPVDTPPMSLPSPTVSSSSGEEDAPRPVQASSPRLASDGTDSRPGLKRKLPGRSDTACGEHSCIGAEDVHLDLYKDIGVTCGRCGGRCGDERGNKRRRLSHGCSRPDRIDDRNAMEIPSERPLDVFLLSPEVGLNVQHTLDVVTSPGSLEQSLDSVGQTLDIVTTPEKAERELGSVERTVTTTTQGQVDQVLGSVEQTVDVISASQEPAADVVASTCHDIMYVPCHHGVTASCRDMVAKSCHSVSAACHDTVATLCDVTVATPCHVATSCDEIVATSCHVATPCDETVVTTTSNDIVATSCHETVATSCDEIVATGCLEVVASSCHETMAASFHDNTMDTGETETALDVVVETSDPVIAENSAMVVQQQPSPTVLEGDMASGENATDDSPSAPLFPPTIDTTTTTITTITSPLHLDRSSGDDVSSEEGEDDAFGDVSSPPRPRRISPFLNTPKQRKEERRKILKLSIQKMRAVDDPEYFLRRSVLINNTMKRLQLELREEKMRNSPRRSCYSLYRRSPLPYESPSHNSYVLHDESFGLGDGDGDRITDDMTDALVTRLEATSSHVVVPTPSPSPCPVAPTPSLSPCPLTEPDTSFVEFPPVPPCQESAVSSCSPDVTSAASVTDCTSSLTSDLAGPCSSLSDDDLMMNPVSTSLESEDMTSSVSDLTSSSDCASFSSPAPSSPCNGVHDSAFTVNHDIVRDSQPPSSSCSSESQKMKQLFAEIDVVFNNLIHAMGDS